MTGVDLRVGICITQAATLVTSGYNVVTQAGTVFTCEVRIHSFQFLYKPHLPHSLRQTLTLFRPHPQSLIETSLQPLSRQGPQHHSFATRRSETYSTALIALSTRVAGILALWRLLTWYLCKSTSSKSAFRHALTIFMQLSSKHNLVP